MTTVFRRFGIGILLVGGVALAWAADPPVKPPPSMKSVPAPTEPPKPKSPEPAKSPPRGLDKLPSGAVYILLDQAKDALQLDPKLVVLSPEEYRRLLDQIEQLKRQVERQRGPNRAEVELPTECKLSGRVEGDVVRLQALFKFETRQPKTLVALGCLKAWPTAATLNEGRLPMLPPPDDDGFVVQVDTPGQHRLTLDLEVPVASRGSKGADRGFDLGLPRAAITTLDSLDLPETVREIRITGRRDPIAAKEINSKNNARRPLPLGPVASLDVAWKGPAPVTQGEPLLAAVGQIDVRIDESHVSIDADLTLQVRRGQTAEWRLQVPPQATLEIKPATDERIKGIEGNEPKSSVRIIQLKEPSSEPLRVLIRVRQPRAGKSAATRVPVGPFHVLNAIVQQGTIAVSAPADVRLNFQMHSEINQRETTDDSRGDASTLAVFTYGNLPPVHPPQPAPAPLTVDIIPVKGVVETKTEHTLTLTDRGWRVVSRIRVDPLRTRVERLRVELPAGYQYDEKLPVSPAELIENPIEITSQPSSIRVADIKLFSRTTHPFTVVMEGLVAVPGGAQHATVELPRPLETIDRGCQVTALAPEGLELLPPEPAGDTPPTNPRKLAWRLERNANRVELAWRKYRPDLPVEAATDVTLTDRHVRIRQRFQFAKGAPRTVLFRIPSSLSGRGADVQGGRLEAQGVPTIWAVTPDNPEASAAALTLEYSVPLQVEAKSRQLEIPLAWPEQASQCQTTVRVWSDPGPDGYVQPLLAGGPWEEKPVVVTEHESLPSLVVRGSTPFSSLLLQLSEPTPAPLAALVVDRLLMQVLVAEDGHYHYRARFLFHKLNTRALEVEFPVALASLNLKRATINGKEHESQIIDDNGKVSEAGRIVRWRIDPDLYRKMPVLLDLSYQLAPGRASGDNRSLMTLHPPQMRGNPFIGSVRWQVSLPSNSVAIYHDRTVTAEQQWDWQGWLLAPRPSRSSADVERWFQAGTESLALPADPGLLTWSQELSTGSGLVGWQSTLAPVRLVHLPLKAWLVLCSLALLGVGLGLYFASPSRSWFWLLIAGLGSAVVFTVMLVPSVLPAVAFGAEPGLAVLAVVIGIQWLLQRRYRRQVIFMPGFTRLKAGSSLVRNANNRPKVGEPSTVDSPPVKGSAGS